MSTHIIPLTHAFLVTGIDAPSTTFCTPLFYPLSRWGSWKWEGWDFSLWEQWVVEREVNSGDTQSLGRIESTCVCHWVCTFMDVYVCACVCVIVLSWVYARPCVLVVLSRSRLSSAVLRLTAKKPRMSAPICTILCKYVCVCYINGTPIAMVPLCSMQPEHPYMAGPTVRVEASRLFRRLLRWFGKEMMVAHTNGWGGGEKLWNSVNILKVNEQDLLMARMWCVREQKELRITTRSLT